MNFPSLKRSLKQHEARDIDVEADLKAIQDKMKPLWIKIGKLRNQSVGHLSREKSQQEVFAHAGVSAQDVQDFMGLAVALHQGITYPRDQSFEAFNIDGKPSTRKLLEDLKKL